MNDVAQLIAAAAQLFASLAVLAVLAAGFFVGLKWFRRMGETGPSESLEDWFDRQAQEREAERETDINNGMRGMSPGWGAFQGQKGSGLHRGRR